MNNKFTKILTMPMLICFGITPIVISDKRKSSKGELKLIPIKKMLTTLNIEFKKSPTFIECMLNGKKLKVMIRSPYGVVDGTFLPYLWNEVNGTYISENYMPIKQEDDFLIPVKFLMKHFDLKEDNNEFYFEFERAHKIEDKIDIEPKSIESIKEDVKDFSKIDNVNINNDISQFGQVEEIKTSSNERAILGITLSPGKGLILENKVTVVPILKLFKSNNIKFTYTGKSLEANINGKELKLIEKSPYGVVNNDYKPYLYKSIGQRTVSQYYIPIKQDGDILIPVTFLKEHYGLSNEGEFYYFNGINKVFEDHETESLKQFDNINVTFDMEKVEKPSVMELDEVKEDLLKYSNVEEKTYKKKLEPILLKGLVDTNITFDIEVLPIKALLNELNIEFKSQMDSITFKVSGTTIKILNAYPYGHIGNIFEPYVTKEVNGKSLSQYYIPKKLGDDILIPIAYLKKHIKLEENYGEFIIKDDEDKFIVDDSDNILLNVVAANEVLDETYKEEEVVSYSVDKVTMISKEDLVLISANENKFNEEFYTIPIIKLLSYQKINYTKNLDCIDFKVNDIEFKVYEKYPYAYINKAYKPYIVSEIEGKTVTQYYIPKKEHGDLLIPVDFLKKNLNLIEFDNGYAFASEENLIDISKEAQPVKEEQVIKEDIVVETKLDTIEEKEIIDSVNDEAEAINVSDVEEVNPIVGSSDDVEKEDIKSKEESGIKSSVKPVILKALVDTTITFDIETLPIKKLLNELNIEFRDKADEITFKLLNTNFKFLKSYPYGKINNLSEPYVVRAINGKKLSQYYIPKKVDGDLLIPIDYLKKHIKLEESYGEFFIKDNEDKFIVDDTDDILSNVLNSNKVEKAKEEDILPNYNVDEVSLLDKEDLVLIAASEGSFRNDFYALPIIKLLSYQKIHYVKNLDCIDFTINDVEFKIYEQYPYGYINKVYKPYLVSEINGKDTTQYYIPKKQHGDLLIPLEFLKKNLNLIEYDNGYGFKEKTNIENPEDVLSDVISGNDYINSEEATPNYYVDDVKDLGVEESVLPIDSENNISDSNEQILDIPNIDEVDEDLLKVDDEVRAITIKPSSKNRLNVEVRAIKIKLLMKKENISVIEHSTNLEMSINGKVFKLFDKYPYGYINGSYQPYLNKNGFGNSNVQYFLPVREKDDFLIPVEFLKEHFGLIENGDEFTFKKSENGLSKETDIIELDDIIEEEHIEEKIDKKDEIREEAPNKDDRIVKGKSKEYTIFNYVEDLYANNRELLGEVDNKVYTSKVVENKLIDLGFVKDEYGYVYNSKEVSSIGLASFNKRSGNYDMQISLYSLNEESTQVVNELVKIITPFEYKKVFEAFNDTNPSYPLKFEVVADTRVIEFKIINKTLLMSFGPMVV